ncbi:MAG: ATP-grasp domain-containing protein [Thermoprotei archaeon]|nr:ATP-grasp domain-containing protein [Thermoprotei archaeon]
MPPLHPPFKKVLIANRGEIAVRIIRTLRRLGITSIAIYSDVDKNSLHVLLADEAYRVGPPDPKMSYLNIDKIVEIAKQSGAEAVHPGYGFLAQNKEFAERVTEEDLIFIGPPSRIHELVSDKLAFKKYLSENGIPVVPGPLKKISSLDEALNEAERIGYPVILKPRFGGGGIGMFICHNEDEIKRFYNISSKLSDTAFGKGDIYMEKYYPKAKHIEVQILADNHNNAVHLFERECSIQRRFQKVLEEAPSPAINDEVRERLTYTALKIVRLVNYVNAGTVEFIYIPYEEKFYFIELNARIQVEHPVTEEITGVDIVKEQIHIAAGERLSISQNEVMARGHAIEARIYAEDPKTLNPCPGIVNAYLPPSGPGIRVDSYLYPGVEVPSFYDPLIAKVIAWGNNRNEAIDRLKVALTEFYVDGITTNVLLHLSVLSNPLFLNGTYNTRTLEENILPNLPQEVSRLRLPLKGRSMPKDISSHLIPVVSAWKLSARLDSLEVD